MQKEILNSLHSQHQRQHICLNFDEKCNFFWVQFQLLRTAYIVVSVAMFATAITLQTNPKFLTDDYSKARLYFFMAWSLFGVLPCTHWALQNGGFGQPYVLVGPFFIHFGSMT
jgi:hypothetical protein